MGGVEDDTSQASRGGTSNLNWDRMSALLHTPLVFPSFDTHRHSQNPTGDDPHQTSPVEASDWLVGRGRLETVCIRNPKILTVTVAESNTKGSTSDTHGGRDRNTIYNVCH